MGFDIETWNDVAGAIFMGAGSSWTGIWTAVSAALCVLALVVGSRHELDAYKREQERSGDN